MTQEQSKIDCSWLKEKQESDGFSLPKIDTAKANKRTSCVNKLDDIFFAACLVFYITPTDRRTNIAGQWQWRRAAADLSTMIIGAGDRQRFGFQMWFSVCLG